MDLTLLKRMAAEVADDTLAVLFTEEVAKFTIGDDVQLRIIDVIVSELKNRHGIVNEVLTNKQAKARNYKAEAERRKQRAVSENGGSLRTESGKLQPSEPGAAGVARVGDETVQR